jgi:aspartate racemase
VIGTNTTHIVADQIARAIRIPILHVADPIAAACVRPARRPLACSPPGSRWRRSSISTRSPAGGLRVLIPKAADRAEVHRVIYEKLVLGKLQESSRETYRRVIADLARVARKGSSSAARRSGC